MTPEEYNDAIMTSEWFAVVNDLVGGWCIALEDKPLGDIDVRQVPVVGEFMTKEVTDYIVKLHNDSFRRGDLRQQLAAAQSKVDAWERSVGEAHS